MLSMQGSGFEPPGMDLVTGLPKSDFVRTNGPYGYGCACLDAEFDRSQRRITRIESVRPMPLSRCRSDGTLPRP